VRRASRNLCLAGCVFLALALAPSCSVQESSTIELTGNFAATPVGPAAVLEVTARPAGAPKTGQRIWGEANTLNAEATFAELLAHAAREDGGMAVILPYQVNDRLAKAKLKPTLQPPPAELQSFVKLLGCASYLTADVRVLGFSYIYFRSTAVAEYSIACHRADNGAIVWQADVARKTGGMSDREVARLSLGEAFRKLKAESAAPRPPEAKPG
jgi:hypothetical protein